MKGYTAKFDWYDVCKTLERVIFGQPITKHGVWLPVVTGYPPQTVVFPFETDIVFSTVYPTLHNALGSM